MSPEEGEEVLVCQSAAAMVMRLVTRAIEDPDQAQRLMAEAESLARYDVKFHRGHPDGKLPPREVRIDLGELVTR